MLGILVLILSKVAWSLGALHEHQMTGLQGLCITKVHTELHWNSISDSFSQHKLNLKTFLSTSIQSSLSHEQHVRKHYHAEGASIIIWIEWTLANNPLHLSLLASQSDAHTIAPHRDPSNPDPDPSHPLIAQRQERPMM